MRNPIGFAVLLCLAPIPARPQADPASLPARDAHEGLLISAEPYTDPARYKVRFGKKTPFDGGILAVEVFFRNDNEQPIRLELETIRLLLSPPGSDRQKLGALSAEDVADRILNKGSADPTARRKPIPVPGRIPKKGRGKDWDELVSALRAVALETDLLPPRSPVHGFLFFDVNHRYDWLAYARLYLPDLKFMGSNKALLFFELDLGAARPR